MRGILINPAEQKFISIHKNEILREKKSRQELRIFFVSGVFRKYVVHFWTYITKDEKVAVKNLFLLNLFFYRPYESLNIFQ